MKKPSHPVAPARAGSAGAVAPSPEVAAFLARALTLRHDAPPGARGRLIFALDATMSRQPTWDLACGLQSEMFDAAARAGGLDVQLVYFRGHAEARASAWVSDAAGLKRLMTGIACHGGLTQIARVLEHAGREAARKPLAALVYVGDAMEEDVDRLCGLAGELGVRGTRAFLFHEGRDPVAARAFREIARLTRGAYLPFDARAAGELGALLAAVGAYAAGGRPALEASGTGAARRLLAGPLAMTLPGWSVLVLIALAAAAFALRRLPPRQVLAAALFALAAGLVVLRQFVLALALAGVALKLWRDGARMTPAPGGSSQVESVALRMTLDHETGKLDGEVTAGPLAGARLSALSAEQLQQLVEGFEASGDEDSLALLLAWLDRNGKARAEPPPAGRPMTEAEAYRVLGLAPGASLSEVRAAYRRLMKRVHPDLGGSGALAAMLNEAKEVLDPG